MKKRQIVLPVALKPFFISLSSTYDTDLGNVISFKELQNTFKLYMDGIFKKREYNFPLKLVIGTSIRYECTMVGYELNVELFGPKCPKRYGFYIELIGQSLTIKDEQRQPSSLKSDSDFAGGGIDFMKISPAIGIIGAAVSIDDQNNPALNEDDSSKSGSEVNHKEELGKKIEEFLGGNPEVKINKHGDKIFISKDGRKRVRVDLENSHGDDPHIHFEKLNSTGRRWKDAFETHRYKPGKKE